MFFGENQEVVRLLRSLPIIGPWTNKQRPGGTAGTAVARGAGGDNGGSGDQNFGFRNGRYYEEEFAVAPADLLAFDEVRRLLALLGRLRISSSAHSVIIFLFFVPLHEPERLPDAYPNRS